MNRVLRMIGVLCLMAGLVVPGGLRAEIWGADRAHQAVKRGELLLIDVRTPKEWRESGVPIGAWPIDMYDAGFGRRLNAVLRANPGQKIGFICAVGVRTGYLEKVFLENGLKNVVNVGEGMFGSDHGPGWLKRGLPVVTADQAVKAMPGDYRMR